MLGLADILNCCGDAETKKSKRSISYEKYASCVPKIKHYKIL